MGHDTLYWKVSGQSPPLGGPQCDGEATSDSRGWIMGLSPVGGRDGRGSIVVGGYLIFLTP